MQHCRGESWYTVRYGARPVADWVLHDWAFVGLIIMLLPSVPRVSGTDVEPIWRLYWYECGPLVSEGESARHKQSETWFLIVCYLFPCFGSQTCDFLFKEFDFFSLLSWEVETVPPLSCLILCVFPYILWVPPSPSGGGWLWWCPWSYWISCLAPGILFGIFPNLSLVMSLA